MIAAFTKRLNRRKLNIFLLFLVCSSLAWFISNLSESYTNATNFDIVYINAPDSLLLVNEPEHMLDVKLRATGFQFLSFYFKKKRVTLDLSTVQKNGLTYFVPKSEYKKQIDKQLQGNMEIVELDGDTLFFEFEQLFTKRVPVIPRIAMDLEQNYMFEGALEVSPDSINIRGTKAEIDSIKGVYTEKRSLTKLTSNFSEKVVVVRPAALSNITFSKKEVIVSGRVSRFSEKIIDVPIKVLNLPEGVTMRTFPSAVSILCKGTIEQLKELRSTDFKLVADYNTIQDRTENSISLYLMEIPEGLHSAKALELEVEFILKRG